MTVKNMIDASEAGPSVPEETLKASKTTDRERVRVPSESEAGPPPLCVSFLKSCSLLTIQPTLTISQQRSMSNVHDILLPGIPGVGFEEGVSEDLPPKRRLEALDSVSVAVAVEVLNGTKFALVPVGVTANGGVIETDQMAVAPSVAEFFVARKHRTRYAG